MRRSPGQEGDGRRGRGAEPPARARPGAASVGPVLAKAVAPSGPADQGEPVRTMLALFFVAGLIAASFWVLWPFLPAIIWATTLVVATFPLMLRVQHQLWNSRGLAV